METLKIQIQVRQVYGNTFYYPVCPAAHQFAHIAGTKTLTYFVLRCIESLGYTIETTNHIAWRNQ